MKGIFTQKPAMRTLVTITSVALCLFCVVGSSYAFTIVQMNPSDGSTVKVDSYSGYTYHSASVTTSEAYTVVDWFVNGVLRDTTSNDTGDQTEASFSPDPISGDLNGKNYTIKAVAKLWVGEEKKSDSASYTLKVFSSVTTYTASRHTNTSGYVTLKRLYYEDPNVFSDGSIYLANQTSEADNNAEKYFYDWVGRLVITTSTGTDVNCTGSGSLEAGEYVYVSCIPLSLNADSKYAERGRTHTAKATYGINVSDGEGPEDSCQLERTYSFFHPK